MKTVKLNVWVTVQDDVLDIDVLDQVTDILRDADVQAYIDLEQCEDD